MSYTAPASGLLRGMTTISTFGTGSWMTSLFVLSATAAWPTANKAVYVPIRVPRRVLVRKLWVSNDGSSGGNVSLGVYDSAGTLITSGNTTTGGIETVIDVTDAVLGPGLYYFAAAFDNTTDQVYSPGPSAPSAAAVGVLSQTSAYPLPATATMALDQTLTMIPVGGLVLDTVAA